MENKQTAVEWLQNQIIELEIKVNSKDNEQVKFLFNQAKAMEKEQIKEAYKSGVAWGYNNMDEYYYNETYGKK